MPRILDINYREYESIPFWKEIVARTIKDYFVEIEGEHTRIRLVSITSIGQMAGKRFRIEIAPDKPFEKEILSARIVRALRDEEVDTIAQKKIEEMTDYLVTSLREDNIRDLVLKEHDDIRNSVESKFGEEKTKLLASLAGIDEALAKKLATKFNSYDQALTKEKLEFDSIVNEVNAKLKDYEKLKRESTDLVENHKNFDGIALGVAVASMFTSLMIILFLLLG
jgi:hypothetical protein